MCFLSAKIAAGAVVCVESEIRGDVTIGETFICTFATFLWLFKWLSWDCWFIVINIIVFTGARTVVHPKARIIAEAGPIIIGEGNLIEEQALIVNR